MMKNISEKMWFSVSIELSQLNDMNILYGKFYNHILGVKEDSNNIIFYFEDNKKKLIKDIISNELSHHQLSIKDIKYENWHTSYEQYFKPIQINEDLIIIPPWHEIDNTQNVNYIKIIPGMAFGTGNHETTQLIISSILENINSNDTVLDLGSGSGILSITALKFGASEVMAIEYDDDCKDNFYENMALNNIADNYSLLIKDVLLCKDYNYDMIVANINKNIILELLPNIKKFRNNKSKIILSGLLIKDKDDVIDLIKELEFNFLKEMEMGEWVCILID